MLEEEDLQLFECQDEESLGVHFQAIEIYRSTKCGGTMNKVLVGKMVTKENQAERKINV